MLVRSVNCESIYGLQENAFNVDSLEAALWGIMNKIKILGLMFGVSLCMFPEKDLLAQTIIVSSGTANLPNGTYPGPVYNSTAVSGGIQVLNPGTVVTASDITLNYSNTSNFSGRAVYINEGSLTISNSSIIASGESNYVFYAINGANLVINNVDITNNSIYPGSGNTPPAMVVNSGSSAIVNNSRITTAGQGGDGARLSGSSIEFNDSTITTSALSANGIVLSTNAFLSGSNTQITTSGAGARGIVSSAISVLDVTGFSIITTGGPNGSVNSDGLSVSTGSGGTFKNGTISVSGSGANGATSNNASLTLEATNILVTGGVSSSGMRSRGLVASAGGLIDVSGSTIEATGQAGTTAGAGVSGRSELNLVDSSVKATQGVGLLAQGSVGANIVTLKNSSLSGAEFAIDSTGTGPTLQMSADASQITGMARTEATATANLVLTNGSNWTMNGSSNLSDLQNNNSTIDFGTPVNGFRTLTTNQYSGASGLIIMHTMLNGDGSPSDQLVIDGGAARGTTGLKIVNAGGLGALTTGDGIAVVSAINGATTDGGAFSLSQRVAAGAYDYFLYQGGNTASGGNADDQNWYLRSVLTTVPSPENPVVPVTVPAIRAEVAVNMVIPALSLEYGYAMLDTLHERVGDTILLPALPAVNEDRTLRCGPGKNCVARVRIAENPGQNRFFAGAWARILGERGFQQHKNFSRRGSDYSYDFAAMQAGLDLWGREGQDGARDKAGIYLGYGQVNSRVNGVLGRHAGSITMDAYTLGGYWTHHGATGWYTDAVIQGTLYDTTAKSIHNERVTPDSWGLLASLEGGYSFKLSGGWTLEPQGQLAYQKVKTDRVTDSFGQFVYNNEDSLRGRLGARVTKTFDLGDGAKMRPLTVWARANLWHEFLGATKMRVAGLAGFNSETFASSLGGTWAEFGVGVTGQIADNVTLFGTGAYNHSLDNHGRESWDGRLGMTIKW